MTYIMQQKSYLDSSAAAFVKENYEKLDETRKFNFV